MLSLDCLENLNTELFRKGKASFSDFREFKKNGELDAMIDALDIIPIMRYKVETYLKLLLNERNCNYYNKKVVLEALFQRDLSPNAEFMLCLYFDCEGAYRDIPTFLYNMIEKLDLKEFKDVDYNYLVYIFHKYYHLIEGYDVNFGKYVCEFKNKPCGFFTNYSNFDERYEQNLLNVYDIDEFFVWAEHKVYDEEYALLEDSKYRNNVRWVAREYGDGYGFDVLSFDEEIGREKLIEVKSGRKEEISLTENEIKCMQTCHRHNADYYIYKYTYNVNTNMVERKILKYDPLSDLLCDNENNFYTYDKSYEEDKNGNMCVRFKINKMNEYPKILVLR